MRKLTVVACGWLCLALPGWAASFDCKKAKTEVEKLICAYARLNTLDDKMFNLYSLTLPLAGEKEQMRIREDQRRWLATRDVCQDRACVEARYKTRLAELEAEKRAMETTRSTQKAKAWQLDPQLAASVAPSSVRFRLTRGQGNNVCEAYLRRLEEGGFARDPRCSRFESNPVPAISGVARVQLRPEEIQPFWTSVRSFLMRGDPDRYRRDDEARSARGLPARYGDRSRQLELIYADDNLRVFRFDPPIDADNDGTPDPVVLWQDGQCGDFGTDPSHAQFRAWEAIPVVLNAVGDGPDVEKTRRLFGHPAASGQRAPGEQSTAFYPIGQNMGFFKYEGVYYFDTFFDGFGDFEGKRGGDPKSADRLGVFLVRKGAASQVCEYIMG
jgi:uncharacterized protein